jgi:acetate kinase
MTGGRFGLREIFFSDDPEALAAMELFLHRLLLSTGSAIAAMDGLDTVVFSGRDATLAGRVRPWLESKLSRLPGLDSAAIRWLGLPWTIHQLLSKTGLG